MAINVFPVNAVAGEPEYSGRELRQMFSALIAGASADRPLGAASGVRVGTPDTTVTATATTWTVKPHSGILDLQTAVEAGPYLYATDADEEGALDPAHATNPRIDIITVRLDDPAESDGSSVPSVTVVYKPGTAAASPTVPTPDTTREMVLARISVPESGGGSPSVTWAAPRAVASGGIVPVRNSSERDALAALIQPTADNPLYVHNQARPSGQELERTTDGNQWLTLQASSGFQPYSPANSGLTVGNGTQTAMWVERDGIVHVSYRLQFGSTTAITGTLNIGLPAPAIAGAHGLGVGYAIDASAGGGGSRASLFVVTGTSPSQVVLRPDGMDLVQANQPFASWGTGDTIGFEVTYRVGV